MARNRQFNAEGPCNPQEHYMLDPLRGLDKQIRSLVNDKKYFVIHAARQSGKTTLLRALVRQIRDKGDYYALFCSFARLDKLPDVAAGIPTIIEIIQNALISYQLPNASTFSDSIGKNSPFSALQVALAAYCRSLDKPLVLMFDEADCIIGETLIAFLRQLRDGYNERDEIPFVHSLALVGMRNIRDYRNDYRDPSKTLGSASPFNISARSMTLRNFTKEEIAELYAQHTADTGQVFQDDAVELVWEQTQGQPWLVNATARIIVQDMTADAPQTPVTAEMVSEAIQMLVLRWDTHFDSLMARLDEERVKSIIEPMIIGDDILLDRNSSDYTYVKDMGLIRDDRVCVEPANPIYGEIIIRTLSRSAQENMNSRGGAYPIPRYLKDGKMDMDVLLRDFQSFWRENEEIWQKKYDYQEAAPLLVLQAFLQRVVNGGGRVARETASGSGRVDLCVFYNELKYPIELKIRRGAKTYIDGIEQLFEYMDKFGCTDGWMVIFDQTKKTPWEERLFVNRETIGSKTVAVYGC